MWCSVRDPGLYKIYQNIPTPDIENQTSMHFTNLHHLKLWMKINVYAKLSKICRNWRSSFETYCSLQLHSLAKDAATVASSSARNSVTLQSNTAAPQLNCQVFVWSNQLEASRKCYCFKEWYWIRGIFCYLIHLLQWFQKDQKEWLRLKHW